MVVEERVWVESMPRGGAMVKAEAEAKTKDATMNLNILNAC